jgi:hypothetical protein
LKDDVIIYNSADAVKLEYLSFNRFDSPAKKCADQNEENKFCTIFLKIDKSDDQVKKDQFILQLLMK